jgi:polyphosphate kinase
MDYIPEPEPEKKKKKNKIPKLKKHVVIKNADKDSGWMETWDYPKNRSLANFPNARILFLGGCGRGKTNQMKHVLLSAQTTQRKFKKVYVVQCGMDSQEWLDIEPTGIFDTIPDLDLFDGEEKTALIFDDWEMEGANKEERRKLTTLFRAISTHKNVQLFCSYQSFFHVYGICRKTANVFCIWKPKSDIELQFIARSVGVKFKDLKQLFKEHCTDYYDFLTFDDTKGSPAKIRKGLYQPIDYESDSDEDDEPKITQKKLKELQKYEGCEDEYN